MQAVQWGEFRIKDIFDVSSSNKVIHANKVKIYDTQIPNTYPYVVRQSKNNGIKGYIQENLKFLNPANTISFAQDTFLSFFQKQKYFTGNNVKVLKYKGKNTIKQKSLMFISIAIQKAIAKLSWGINSSKESILETKFLLPIDDQNQINFDFIEKFIKELESAHLAELETTHLAELEAYLIASGFTQNNFDYSERERERAASQAEIENLYSNTIWKEFRIKDIFEQIKTKNVITNGPGDLPATTAISTNNQLGRYINPKGATILQNVFSATANGNGKVFFQPKPFTILQDSYAFKFKYEVNNKKQFYLFFLGSLNKIFQKYSWDNKSTWKRVSEELITLPVNNQNEIDFDFIEKFTFLIMKIILNEIIDHYNKKVKNILICIANLK
ncbi:restriction endonuclease subunit S [Mesomycoplasma ovipneumoniae]|uniref:restriction endonuclease subunit S n=1 Tax=Mesomycoplasma ovipneumoniae TaxID=29562 RepID=UPI0009C060F5|nr:restriction endonuclease subunit S [Mesomycoplasma ovipneumoniae]